MENTAHTLIKPDSGYGDWQSNLRTFPYGLQLSLYVETLEEAQALAAEFPKSAKVIATTCNMGRVQPNGTKTVGVVHAQVKTAADGVNGGINETGAKRLASMRKTLARLGFTVASPTPTAIQDTTEELVS